MKRALPRTSLYVALLATATIVAMPMYWLMVSAFKASDEIFTPIPRWLPSGARVAQLRARLARRRLWPLFCQQRRGHGSNPPVATNDFESCGFRTRPPTLSRARHYSPHRHRRADHPDPGDVFGQFRYVATLWLVGQLLGLDRALYG